METASVGGEVTSQEPRLGWAALSRTRLNKAEAQLEQGQEGVRDEVGVLALHTAYADRFFPGTSTQQRRLRYALFVPWQIESLLRRKTTAAQARGELERGEIQLANRLSGEEFGVIGVQNAAEGRPVSIPASSVVLGGASGMGRGEPDAAWRGAYAARCVQALGEVERGWAGSSGYGRRGARIDRSSSLVRQRIA